MVKLIADVALSPALVGAATLAGRRWGQRVAGLVSGLPVVVGPLLLIAARERGLGFAASAANGVLLGLPALGAFAVVYARSAGRRPVIGLLSGWASAGALAALMWLSPVALPFPAGLVVAAISLSIAFALIPGYSGETATSPRPAAGLRAVSLRMGATAALVLVLWTALAVLGPMIGGILAALPTVVSVLVVFARRERGPEAAVCLLRGALAGMAGFVGFCAVIASALPVAGVAITFAVAIALSAGLQAVMQLWITRASRTAPPRTRARAV